MTDPFRLGTETPRTSQTRSYTCRNSERRCDARKPGRVVPLTARALVASAVLVTALAGCSTQEREDCREWTTRTVTTWVPKPDGGATPVFTVEQVCARWVHQTKDSDGIWKDSK